MTTGRLEAFSDGVLAIIITIMVLDLRVPKGHTVAALEHVAGTDLLTYLLTFIYVGIYWNNHHHMFQLTDRLTGAVLWANLGLLFCLSLLPFSTAWMDRSHLASSPVVAYGVNLLGAAVAYFVLQRVIIHTQGEGAALRRAVGRDVKGRVSVGIYAVGIACALLAGVGIWLAAACFVAVAVLWLVPDRRIERVARELGASD